MARPFRHRNYRLFFGGQSISLLGTWMTRIATSWLVYRLTGSSILLGLVAFWGQIPTLVVTPLAGVLIDRSDRHRIMVITQVLSLVQSAALAALTLSGAITVPYILILQTFQGIINAFDTPARQSFVVQMVDDRRDLPNAIALNSTMVNVSRILGPSIAGILIAMVGEGWCFAIDSVSYVPVIYSLLAMNVVPHERSAAGTRLLDELRTGFRYVTGSPPLRMPLLLLAVVSAMGVPYSTLMPVMATEVLHGGPNLYGALMTAAGGGSLLGALYLASRHTVVGLSKVTVAATLTFGASLVVLALSQQRWLSLAVLPLVGAGFMVQMAAINTILQTIVEERFRGRVMAYYTMAFIGSSPIGSLAAGFTADRVGAPVTIMLGGAVCIVAGCVYWIQLPKLRAAMRPIYEARGLIPVAAVDPPVPAVDLAPTAP